MAQETSFPKISIQSKLQELEQPRITILDMKTIQTIEQSVSLINIMCEVKMGRNFSKASGFLTKENRTVEKKQLTERFGNAIQEYSMSTIKPHYNQQSGFNSFHPLTENMNSHQCLLGHTDRSTISLVPIFKKNIKNLSNRTIDAAIGKRSKSVLRHHGEINDPREDPNYLHILNPYETPSQNIRSVSVLRSKQPRGKTIQQKSNGFSQMNQSASSIQSKTRTDFGGVDSNTFDSDRKSTFPINKIQIIQNFNICSSEELESQISRIVDQKVEKFYHSDKQKFSQIENSVNFKKKLEDIDQIVFDQLFKGTLEAIEPTYNFEYDSTSLNGRKKRKLTNAKDSLVENLKHVGDYMTDH